MLKIVEVQKATSERWLALGLSPLALGVQVKKMPKTLKRECGDAAAGDAKKANTEST